MLNKTFTSLIFVVMFLFLIVPIGAETGNIIERHGKLSVESDIYKLTQPSFFLNLIPQNLPKNSPELKVHNQIKCLADNIYYEAGGEPDLGKIAVARVTMNRVHSGKFANTVCGVVYQGAESKEVNARTGCQFSWTCYRDQIKQPVAAIWRRCYEIAANVMLQDAHSEIVPGVYFFHADYADVHYKLAYVAQIGHHMFYRRSDDK